MPVLTRPRHEQSVARQVLVLQLIAVLVLVVTALALAVLRSLPGPVFFPVRALAIAYADFFRGVPTILVIALLGFGAPALAIEGVPTSTTWTAWSVRSRGPTARSA